MKNVYCFLTPLITLTILEKSNINNHAIFIKFKRVFV